MPLLMKMPTITGESTVHEHIGWLGLVGFNWGGTRVVRASVANQRGDKAKVWAPQLRSATARRTADAQTAQLWRIMVQGTELPAVRFEWLRTGQGMPICFFSVELGGVHIARISEDSSGEHPIEALELLYRTITLGVRDVGNTLSGAQDMVHYIIPQHVGG